MSTANAPKGLDLETDLLTGRYHLKVLQNLQQFKNQLSCLSILTFVCCYGVKQTWVKSVAALQIVSLLID